MAAVALERYGPSSASAVVGQHTLFSELLVVVGKEQLPHQMLASVRVKEEAEGQLLLQSAVCVATEAYLP